MKKILSLSALILVGITAAAELAATAGLSVPAVINTQNLLVAFVVGFTALIVAVDYAPRKMLALPARTAAPRNTGDRHSAYSIRRGAEAARLATPPARVAIFPKSAVACGERAA